MAFQIAAMVALPMLTSGLSNFRMKAIVEKKRPYGVSSSSRGVRDSSSTKVGKTGSSVISLSSIATGDILAPLQAGRGSHCK